MVSTHRVFPNYICFFFFSSALSLLNILFLPQIEYVKCSSSSNIQRWRFQFPASVPVFAKPGRSLPGQPPSHPELQPISTPAQHPTSALRVHVAPSSIHWTTWNCNLHLLWHKAGKEKEGGRIYKWPWDSDFLSSECVDWVCQGDKGQEFHVTALP